MGAMKVQERTKRSRARALLGVMIAAACVGVSAPAMGQGNGQGQGTSCVRESLACAAEGADGGTAICQSFQSCYVTATDSLYFSVDDRRFECNGLQCEQAQAQLNAYCCPPPEEPAVKYSDGCALGHAASASGSLALIALGSLLRLRRRRAS
jgi:hypothetical protein